MVHITSKFEAVFETSELRARAYLGELLETSMVIENRSGVALDMFWVDHDGTPTKMTTIPETKSQKLESWVNNEFMLVETGDCELESSGKPCRSTRFKNYGNDPSESFQTCVFVVMTMVVARHCSFFRALIQDVFPV